MSPVTLAQSEREYLCDLFLEVGPDAPTLCEGWTTNDLAAHLVVRERRPDSGPGLVWAPLSGHTEKVRLSAKERSNWAALIAAVRSGPPMLLRPFDGAMNTIEFFIHVEDVRRAQPEWVPRPLPEAMADALWKRTGPGGMAKKVAGTVVLEAPGRDAKESGSGPRLVLSGDPGELMLFSAGRQPASKVEITGEVTLAAQLRAAALGI